MNTLSTHQPKIVRKTSPYLRRPKATVKRMMRDVIIALLPLVLFAFYSFGIKAFWIIVTAILSMVVTEYVYYQIIDAINKEKFKLKNKSFSLYNYSALISGLIFGLTLSDETAIWVVAITGALGILLAKLFFGGLGQNIFNPAALARVLVAVNFATLNTYGAHLAVIDGQAGATFLSELNRSGAMFSQGLIDHYPLWNLFTGLDIPGSLGEVSALLILLGGLYLALRRSFEVRIPLVYIGTVFLLASGVALYEGVGIWYPLAHILSGGLMFGAVFMATDPVTSPITLPGRVYYAFSLGVLTFVIRLFGALPEGVVFSILIMNMFVASFDYTKWTNPRFTKKGLALFGLIVLLILVSLFIALGAMGIWYLILTVLILSVVLVGVYA
jgi:electron transport complex protein RnfD